MCRSREHVHLLQPQSWPLKCKPSTKSQDAHRFETGVRTTARAARKPSSKPKEGDILVIPHDRIKQFVADVKCVHSRFGFRKISHLHNSAKGKTAEPIVCSRVHNDFQLVGWKCRQFITKVFNKGGCRVDPNLLWLE